MISRSWINNKLKFAKTILFRILDLMSVQNKSMDKINFALNNNVLVVHSINLDN